MQIQFSKILLLRQPVKSPVNFNDPEQQFLNEEHFRAAILLASPVFYELLNRHHFVFAELSLKEKLTLRKYINRYCYRPTPFGLFASVSLVEWVTENAMNSTVPSFKADFRTAMPFENLLSSYLLEHKLKDKARFEGNPSLYRVLNEYRFFRTTLDDTCKQREYQLQSIAFSRLLKDLITASKNGFSRQEIAAEIIRSAGCTAAEAEDYTEFLIDAQLMVNQFRLPITGNDYLLHLAAILEPSQISTGIRAVLSSLKDKQTAINPETIEQLEGNLTALLPEKTGYIGEKLSIILKRDTISEGLATSYQETIRDGVAALEMLSPIGQSAAMTQFINSFQQHFEGQTLPLLQALDPEAGIGYQQPETEKNNTLLETLHIPYKSPSKETGYWSPAHSLLMEAWLRDKTGDPVIRLQDDELQMLKKKPANAEPMLGMSVLFRITGDQVFIENAGGINAPALMGRFTVADEQITAAAQLMARQLEEQNPDFIFAELLHLSDPHTDNVNRRAHIYHYEIPVTAASTLPAAQQIQLSDLYLRIIQNKVFLFSEKHQKIVVPRLTSAYNHSLNKLPLFRFLADLPYQYGRSSLGLDLRQFFPNLHFYPRVEYKQSILSLATWVITGVQLHELQKEENPVQTFEASNTRLRLPKYFSLSEGDQELVFDSQSERDIHFFCQCIRQKKEVVLKEFFEQPAVRQYNAYLLPAEPLVLPKPVSLKSRQPKIKRKYVPGSEWLYLKVYAPRIGTNRLLLRLRSLISKRYGLHRIIQWFFIRYDDHAPHIRLRLKVKPEAISEVLMAFKTKLEDRIQQHVIREFQVDVYTRELERYAAGGIENTEQFFWASSELVLHFFKQSKNTLNIGTPLFALYSTYVMIREFITEADEQILFTLNSFQQFLPEFADVTVKVELDKKYRELSAEISSAFRQNDPALLSGAFKAGTNFARSLQHIQQNIKGHPDADDYLRSIIHMHLNRIFTDEPRKQEMICYYLLYKYLQSVKGRNKQKKT